MKFKQLSIRLNQKDYNQIQRLAVVQNQSMNSVFNQILVSHLSSLEVIENGQKNTNLLEAEVRRVGGKIAEMFLNAVPPEISQRIENIKSEIENGGIK